MTEILAIAGRTCVWLVLCILAIPAIPFFLWCAIILFWINGESPMSERLPIGPEAR